MKQLTRIIFSATILTSLFASSTYADDTTPDWGNISAYAVITSDYRFRGISQNDKQPSEQGSLNWTGPDGFYVGTWLAKINWGDEDPSLEVDFYGGKHFDLDGTDLNIEAIYYTYPDANFPGTTASYYETILQLTHAFGPLTVMVTGANSPNWSRSEGTGWYGEGTATFTINDWLTISGNIGHQSVAGGSFALPNYTHGDIGLTATYKSLVLDARFVDTDLSKAKCAAYMFPSATESMCGPGFVATLTYNMNSFPW